MWKSAHSGRCPGHGSGLDAGWQSCGGHFVLWLVCGGESLAVVELSERLSGEDRGRMQAELRDLGASQVVAVRLPREGLGSLHGPTVSPDWQAVVEAATQARDSALPASLRTVGFELSVFGDNLRQGGAITKPWRGSAAWLSCEGRRLLLAALPTSTLPRDGLRAWQGDVAELCQVSALFLLPCWIADWGHAVALSAQDFCKLVQSTNPDTATASWRALKVKISAREMDGERLSDSLDLSRSVAVANGVPSREAFISGEPSSRAFFAKAELAAAASRADRFLDLMHVTLGRLHFTVLPGPPVEALARRILTRTGDDAETQLICQCAGGGVLSTWSSYRDCDYETQAAFQPHSIGTGDYLVAACSQLARQATL